MYNLYEFYIRLVRVNVKRFLLICKFVIDLMSLIYILGVKYIRYFINVNDLFMYVL